MSTFSWMTQSGKRMTLRNLYCCSVAQLCLSLCDLTDCSTQASLSFTISWSLLKFMYIESTMPSNHLILCLPPSPPALKFSQHQGLFNESALCIRWPKYWNFSFSNSPSNEYSGLISFRIDWTWFPCSPRESQESSPTPQFKSINSLALRFLHSPTLTSLHDYWKNHSLD